MPAFGYMLLLNENVHQYLTIKYDGWLLRYLPSVWRIWLLFYGSFFLAAGSILFSFYCPRELKRYASAFEMADGETEHQYKLGQVNMEKDLVRALLSKRSKWEKEISGLSEQELERSQSGYGADPKSDLSKLFMHHWHLSNIQRPTLRIPIFLLFATGLSLLVIPAAVTFIQVTVLPFRRFTG